CTARCLLGNYARKSAGGHVVLILGLPGFRIRKETIRMQVGSEYLVILNDARLREGYIQRHQKEARSIRQRKAGDSQSAAAHIAHLLMTTRHRLMRFRQMSPSVSAVAD